MTAQTILSHDWFPRPLPANVLIGERSWVYSSFAFLHYRSRQPCGVRIGRDCGIYNGTFFDLGPDGQVEIGDFCSVVGAIISCNSRVTIGDYSFVAHEVVIADRAVATPPSDERDAPPDDSPPVAEICIGSNVWIGARALLLGGAQIGEGAIVGAAAVVDFVVPDYAVVAGNPARIVSRVRP